MKCCSAFHLPAGSGECFSSKLCGFPLWGHGDTGFVAKQYLLIRHFLKILNKQLFQQFFVPHVKHFIAISAVCVCACTCTLAQGLVERNTKSA